MKIERFEDIEAWQLARELTHKVYRLTKKQGFEKDNRPDVLVPPFADSSIIPEVQNARVETNHWTVNR
jgi:hypothetical protein